MNAPTLPERLAASLEALVAAANRADVTAREQGTYAALPEARLALVDWKEQREKLKPKPGFVIHKIDVALALANALMRLGKNDWEGVDYHVENARRLFEGFRTQAAERQNVERLVVEALAAEERRPS